VCILAGALQSTRGFGKENYDTLITKTALHGSKLLKKPDQCRAVYLASHLWWGIEIPARGEEDPKDVSLDLFRYTLGNTVDILASSTVTANGYWNASREPCG
jgi:Vacuolar protein sorting-associated protein 35